MPSIKLKATKMSDAKVSFISLVERGANRIPFKIVKKEKGMAGKSGFAGLDLSNLFTQKAEAAPEKVEVVGVITMKGETYDSVKEQLEANGFNVAQVTELDDGSVVFKQGDADTDGEGELIRINDDIALITKGFHPYMMSMNIGDESFEQICKAQGFFPGVGTVMDVLRSGVLTLAEKSEAPTDASVAIANLFDEAKQYVTKMVAALPPAAFSAEAIYGAVPSRKDEGEVAIVTEASPAEVVVEKGDGFKVCADCKTPEACTKAGECAGKSKEVVKSEVCKECGGKVADAKVSVKDDADACVCGVDLTESEIAVGVEKAAMSDEEKAYAGTLAGAKKFAFMRMSSEERAKCMKEKATKTDPTDTVAPVVEVPAADVPVVEAKKAEESLTPEQVSAIVSSHVTESFGALTQKMESLIGGLTATVNESIKAVDEKVTKSLTEMQDKVHQVEKTATTVKDTVSGIVVGGGDKDDREVPVVKNESRGSLGREIDTAYNPSIRTRRK